jgi:7-cyano-7-deazaguanine synthase in queuosine biosynthesis
MPERLILCGGARRAGGDSTLRLALSGPSRNITLRLEDISRKLVRNVPGLLIDLIEIASYVYCADQAIRRGGEVQRAMGADWRRDFRFVIPVRNPDHWKHPSVSEPLCTTLSFLSEDNYAFEFEKATNPVPFQNYLEFGEDAGVAFNSDEVVLFSGGLDSLSGAIEELSTTAKRLALVSHHSSSKIFDHQRRLIAELKKRFPQRLIHLPVLMTRQQETLPAPEYTHRSRSFLYAALACAVGRLFGKGNIRFYENGVLSINLPIAEQVVGARATRTTHPLVLQRFCEFFSAAVGKPIEFENPFIWKTKADVIRSIVDRGCGELIRDTVSCTRTYDITKLHTHCGCCSQCLDRRFAVLAAGAAEHDPVDMYKIELFTGERDKDEDKTMAECYVRTALELRDMGELAFFGRFSGQTARVCDGFPSTTADEIGRQVIDLHQRHAQAIEEVLTAAVKGHSGALVKGGLPSSSLLMMTVTRGGEPALASIAKRTDPLKTWLEEAESASTERAGTRTDGGRSKSRPAFERAQRVIEELYPDGVPDQATESNKTLCRRVSEKLKEAVSPDTILRAAGRRK